MPASNLAESRAFQVGRLLAQEGADPDSFFTKFPHLTLSVHRTHVFAHSTLPRGMQAEFRRNLKELGEEGFLEVLQEIEKNLRPVVRKARAGAPWCVALQRHYQSQRSVGTVDARLEFDLRTATQMRGRAGSAKVKAQDRWARSAYEVFIRPRSNYQIAVGAMFPYRKGSRIATREAIDLIEASWIGCRPLLRIAMGRR